jgi:uncharacterized protein YhfF
MIELKHYFPLMNGVAFYRASDVDIVLASAHGSGDDTLKRIARIHQRYYNDEIDSVEAWHLVMLVLESVSNVTSPAPASPGGAA